LKAGGRFIAAVPEKRRSLWSGGGSYSSVRIQGPETISRGRVIEGRAPIIYVAEPALEKSFGDATGFGYPGKRNYLEPKGGRFC